VRAYLLVEQHALRVAHLMLPCTRRCHVICRHDVTTCRQSCGTLSESVWSVHWLATCCMQWVCNGYADAWAPLYSHSSTALQYGPAGIKPFLHANMCMCMWAHKEHWTAAPQYDGRFLLLMTCPIRNTLASSLAGPMLLQNNYSLQVAGGAGKSVCVSVCPSVCTHVCNVR
jgi:hypothetical protein